MTVDYAGCEISLDDANVTSRGMVAPAAVV
jgi:hypothetical protein